MFKWLYGSVLFSKADRLGTYAAALAYCFVLSLIPFLVVTFAVGLEITAQLALKNDVYANGYAEVLQDVLPMEKPADVARILDVVLNPTSTENNTDAFKKKNADALKSGLVAVGFLLAVYTSFNLMNQIVRTLNFIFDDPRRPQEWSWKVVGKALLLLLIWMGLLLLISISAAEAAGLKHFLDKFPLSSLSKKLVTASQILVIVSALFGTFYLTYYLVPAKRHKTRYVVEGSLLASVGWIVCSLIFATEVPKLLQTSAAYIALGSIVAILLWAQACAWSIIVGACWIVRFSPRPK